MEPPPIHHPPEPEGATERELQTISTLHREAIATPDRVVASAMLAGLGLIVELIEARGKRLDFQSQWERDRAEGSAE